MDLSGLNKKQQEIVTLPIDHRVVGKILVLAGAGSGKTKVLSNRIAYLVASGVPGTSIVAITFTKKAAGEMAERVGKMVPKGTRIILSTFHSLAVEILKTFVGSNFTILDDADQRAMLQRIVAELKKDPTTGALFSEFEMKAYLEWLGTVRARCADPRVPPRPDLEESEQIVGYRRLSQAYYAQKGDLLYDFDDLIEKTVELLKSSPAAMNALHHRWKYILVDEYQDTNARQFEFVSLIRGADCQLLEVGDEDQLIYSWRGAQIGNILSSYEQSLKDPLTKCVMLTTNYRCSGNILALANEVISVNNERAGKTLDAHNPPGVSVKVKLFNNDFDEADYIAMQVLKWQREGYRFDDVAVLLRTNGMSMPIERALLQRKIPYKIYNGASLFDRMEVRLMMNILLMTQNPSQTLYFAQVMDQVKVGVGPAALRKWELERALAKQSWPEYLSGVDFAKGRVSAPLMQALLSAWKKSAELLDAGLISSAAGHWLREFPFFEIYKEEERERRAESVMILLQLIEAYEDECKQKSTQPSVSGFQEQRLLNDAMVDPAESGKVHIMTMHKAKGLEFPVGFIPGMQDGLFPRNPDAVEGIEEDVRLAYVGITRFKRELFLTRARDRIRVNNLAIESTILDPHLPALRKNGQVEYVS